MKSYIKKRNKSKTYPCDICGAIEYLESHHIDGRNIKNYNKEFNVCHICPNCHNKVHWGDIIIEQWVMTTVGAQLLWRSCNEEKLIRDSHPPLIK